MTDHADRLIDVGRINGAYGVRGWVRVTSYTKPKENVLDYRPWRIALGDTSLTAVASEGRRHGNGLVARLDIVEDRSGAERLAGSAIRIMRSQLPDTDDDSFYWTDLVGLDVVTVEGETLGRLERLFETGANDVMVVAGERERLIPFVRPDTVRDIDLDKRRIVVAWDPDF